MTTATIAALAHILGGAIAAAILHHTGGQGPPPWPAQDRSRSSQDESTGCE